MKKSLIGLITALVLSVPVQSMAATYQVYAQANSTSGGTGLNVSVFAGQSFSVTVNPNDLWNAGDYPRWSNADGLTKDLLSLGLTTPDFNLDVPGAGLNGLIGTNFGLYSQGNLTAPFGTLVGQFGSGDFFKIGTSYTGVAAGNTLKLFYFDSNNGDNTGSILANVTAVPEPETYGMMLVGLGLMGFMVRRRKNDKV